MFEITRKIEIDAGHRIREHGSKCRNLHGHRYQIHVSVRSDQLVAGGSESGMVADFSFLKELMISEIDGPCDHAFILDAEDTLYVELFGLRDVAQVVRREARAARALSAQGSKMYVVPFAPTAENLAAHWHALLAPLVSAHGKGGIFLAAVRAFETPNCEATFPAPGRFSVVEEAPPRLAEPLALAAYRDHA
ncbi:6-pyruvoyl tetrahydropterin synthase [Rhodospirillum rubrum]|uniref:6-carboxytetrahydropterin synthase n=1 Tax=Rhodospirillum rubrum TaxID=1085 RepID=UPI0019086574|nr:6-carboxytetrahydropterin synthase [Rhodospirillum rubrum]MBK1664148.1 6-pyruvoyl tetrahydropterin synthase [Rhodospirillum rubrum]MBK1675831.1 6-pyruvoyl tetrahydropterin synthase [Rhodospirillum rubrum]